VPVSPEILVVLAIVLAALVLFATEAAPVDVTAIGIMVSLLLVEPITGAAAGVGLLAEPFAVVSPEEGISGFASVATVTVLSMFVLSAGVERTGIVETLGERVSAFTGGSERRQLGATIGIVGPISGFINNTAAVAILMPMVSDLAKKGGTSPSKLLLPLSYASMFGGTLTLIGTSTNILASDLWVTLGPTGAEQFSMFEFTKLGVIVALVGTAYLFTVGWWLTPERIKAEEDLTSDFELSEYLTEVVVREESPLVGRTVREALASMEGDVDVVQLIRENRTFGEPLGQKVIRGGDVFVVRTDRESLIDVSEGEGLDLLPEIEVSDAELETAEQNQGLVEVVVAPRSSLIGETLATARFRERYDATVLALRRGPELMRSRLDRVSLRVGDTLLVQATEDSLGRLNRNRDFIVAQRVERAQYRREKVPIAVGIVLGVVALARGPVGRDLPARGRDPPGDRDGGDGDGDPDRRRRRRQRGAATPDRRARPVLRRHGAVDERGQQQRQRRVDDPGGRRGGDPHRRRPVRVRAGGHLRGQYGVHDARGIPDEPVRLRPRRLSLL